MTNPIATTIYSQIDMLAPSQKSQKKDFFPIATLSGGILGLKCLNFSTQASSHLSTFIATKLLQEEPQITLDILWNHSSASALMALSLFTLSTTAFYTPAIFKKIEQIKNQNLGNSNETLEQIESEAKPQITEFISDYAKNIFSMTLGLSFIDRFGDFAFLAGFAAKNYLNSEYDVSQNYILLGKTQLLAATIILAAASTPFLAGKVKDYLNKQEESTT